MAKKEDENSTIKFLSLSIDDYEKSFSFLSEAGNRIKSLGGSMKLIAAFPSTPNKFWVRNTSSFCQNCFRTSFKPESTCYGCRIVDLQRKRNFSIASSSEKAVKIPENEAAIEWPRGSRVWEEGLCRTLAVDDFDAKISFYEQ